MEAGEAKARGISDMESLEREEPGMAKAVQDFFRLYKVVLYNSGSIRCDICIMTRMIDDSFGSGAVWQGRE